MTGVSGVYENIFTYYFTTMIITAGITQVDAGRCKGLKSVGKHEENYINDLAILTFIHF